MQTGRHNLVYVPKEVDPKISTAQLAVDLITAAIKKLNKIEPEKLEERRLLDEIENDLLNAQTYIGNGSDITNKDIAWNKIIQVENSGNVEPKERGNSSLSNIIDSMSLDDMAQTRVIGSKIMLHKSVAAKKIKLQWKKLDQRAKIPTKNPPEAAAYDVCALNRTVVKGNRNGVTIVKTGIAMKIPKGYYARVALRSSFSKKGALVTAGVIDRTYRGEVMVMLVYTGDEDIIIEEGERFAQLILEAIYEDESEIVDYFSDEEKSTHAGFGSTGKF